MVGTTSLYDAEGERQHTTYVAASPESGRATFLERMLREVVLKHEIGGAKRLLGEMEVIPSASRFPASIRDGLQDAIICFRNHHQMHYAQTLSNHLPMSLGYFLPPLVRIWCNTSTLCLKSKSRSPAMLFKSFDPTNRC
jgi:hypothetical protein